MRSGEIGRRDFLVAATATAAVTAAGSALAGSHADHQHHHPKTDEKLSSAAAACVTTGDVCIAHCLDEFKAGRTELAECAFRVEELIAACTALMKLAALRSSELPAFAAATARICKQCEKECLKHAKKHPSCASCAEACEACRLACDEVTAA